MNASLSKCLIGALLAAGLPGVAAADLNDGLVAYYPFNGNADDESGNGNHGIPSGATLTLIADRFGNPDSAYRFNNDTDFIAVQSEAIALTGTAFTLTAWIRIDDHSATHRNFLRRGNHANYEMAVSGDCTRFGYSSWPPPNYEPNYCTGTLAVPLDEWTMVTGVYDRDAGTTRLYVNDELDVFNPDALDPWDPGGPMEIGNWFGTRNWWDYPTFVGDIDDVRVYDRALTGEEIAQLYNPDADGDGILDDEDMCADTVVPEGVPTEHLGVNRWALIDDDGVFDTMPPPGNGKGPRLGFTLEDTAGCSCEQIVAALGLGQGHVKFGCSSSAMQDWIELLPACSPAPADLVCWWPMDESGGTGVQDVVGGNDGYHVSDPTPIEGMVDLALDFDGIDDRVVAMEVVPHDPRDLTVAAWIYPNDLGDCGFPSVLCRNLLDYGPHNGLTVYNLGLDAFGDLVSYPCDDSLCYLYNSVGAGVPVQAWTHVAITANSSTGEFTFYVDGSSVPMSGGVYNPTTWTSYPYPRSWTIGDTDWGSVPFDGRIDELQIFERALSAEEVESIYEAGSYGLCHGEAGEQTLCHVPTDDPAGAYEVTVREFLVPVHLDHGDYLGPCGGTHLPFSHEGTPGSGLTELLGESASRPQDRPDARAPGRKVLDRERVRPRGE